MAVATCFKAGAPAFPLERKPRPMWRRPLMPPAPAGVAGALTIQSAASQPSMGRGRVAIATCTTDPVLDVEGWNGVTDTDWNP